MCISVVCNGGSSDQELDQPASKFGLGTFPGPERLREIVPNLGDRLKVHNVLRSLASRSR